MPENTLFTEEAEALIHDLSDEALKVLILAGFTYEETGRTQDPICNLTCTLGPGYTSKGVVLLTRNEAAQRWAS